MMCALTANCWLFVPWQCMREYTCFGIDVPCAVCTLAWPGLAVLAIYFHFIIWFFGIQVLFLYFIFDRRKIFHSAIVEKIRQIFGSNGLKMRNSLDETFIWLEFNLNEQELLFSCVFRFGLIFSFVCFLLLPPLKSAVCKIYAFHSDVRRLPSFRMAFRIEHCILSFLSTTWKFSKLIFTITDRSECILSILDFKFFEWNEFFFLPRIRGWEKY